MTTSKHKFPKKFGYEFVIHEISNYPSEDGEFSQHTFAVNSELPEQRQYQEQFSGLSSPLLLFSSICLR